MPSQAKGTGRHPKVAHVVSGAARALLSLLYLLLLCHTVVSTVGRTAGVLSTGACSKRTSTVSAHQWQRGVLATAY
jgi:hypothetical protein